MNANFCIQHPYFLSLIEKQSENFANSGKNLLPLSVSMASLDTDLIDDALVKQEAMSNCYNESWASFLCIMGLSSVLHCNICTYYPDCGQQRPKLLFNADINPRVPGPEVQSIEPIHILFCCEGTVKHGEVFKPNHFVPLLFNPTSQKRKSVAATSTTTVKKQKVIPVGQLSSKVMKKVEGNLPSTGIKKFFTVSEKPDGSQFSNNFVTGAAATSDTTSDTRVGPSSFNANPSSTVNTTGTSVQSNLDTCKPSSMNKFDIAHYGDMVKGMSDSEINNLLQHVFKPDKNYAFPKTDGRAFRYEWLDMFKWLCYSPSANGAYCLSCVLFGHRFPSKAGKICKLFFEPLVKWNNAVFTFKKHAGHGTGAEMGLHASTFPILQALLSQISGAAQPINLILDANLRKEVANNRQKLAPIVDTVILCARGGISLRGHRDDSQYHQEIGGYSTGQVGNFVDILNYGVRRGDKVLEEHLKTCGKNQTYISKTSQNKIIKCCGQIISEHIIHDVKKSKFYSILADEASDSSHREQMSLVLRFVDSKMDIREEFIAFLHCKWGLSGAQLSKLILDYLHELTLSISDCRGQGYDGAGSVAGHINGLSAHILKLNPKALYTHCFSHRLNLSICDSLSITEITEMLKHVKDISNFIKISQTRSIPFEESVKSSNLDTKKTKLVDVCRTRWVERIEGLNTFNELFVPLFRLLEEIRNGTTDEYNKNMKRDALTYLTLISRFDFIVTLVITRRVLDLTLPVTQLLQGKTNDVMDGIHLINSLKDHITLMRNTIDDFHNSCYEEALDLAEKVDVSEWKPRTTEKQTARANTPHNSISDYYKKIITIPLVDHLNSSLTARFDLDSVNVYKGLSIVPFKMLSLIARGIDWKDDFKHVSLFYHDDLPTPLALDAELSLWVTYWQTYNGAIPSNIASTLKSVCFDGFENIKVILRILGTLPITSCECERSISSLRMLKDYKRSTMVDERLNGLALMKIHPEIVPDVQKVIDKFAVGNTRLKFV